MLKTTFALFSLGLLFSATAQTIDVYHESISWAKRLEITIDLEGEGMQTLKEPKEGFMNFLLSHVLTEIQKEASEDTIDVVISYNGHAKKTQLKLWKNKVIGDRPDLDSLKILNLTVELYFDRHRQEILSKVTSVNPGWLVYEDMRSNRGYFRLLRSKDIAHSSSAAIPNNWERPEIAWATRTMHSVDLNPKKSNMIDLKIMFGQDLNDTVSYTHLRAHETR